MGLAFMRSTEPERTRGYSEGRCFLYVLPCRDEDLVKIGFSRDPLVRMESLHARYFDFFDLDHGFLVETDTVREARRLELELKHAIAAHNAPQPLPVHDPAGGASEWFRGAYPLLLGAADRLERGGFKVHQPLRPWIGARLSKRSELVFGWAEALMAGIEGEPSHLDLAPYRALRGQVLATLDAYSTLDIPVAPVLPEGLMSWYRRAWRSTHFQPLPGEHDDAFGQSA